MRNSRVALVVVICVAMLALALLPVRDLSHGAPPSTSTGSHVAASAVPQSIAAASETAPAPERRPAADATDAGEEQRAQGLVVAGVVETVAYGFDQPQPISGATVELRLRSESGIRVLDPIRTASDGRFRVGVPDLDREKIERVDGFAWAAGFRGDDDFESPSGRDVEIKFQLDRAGGAVYGRVVDAQSAPVQDVNVILLHPGDADEHRVHCYTDPDGTYRLSPDWVGAATVCARTEAAGAATPVSVWIASDGITRVADLVLHSDNVLAGQVVDLDGRPVRNATVHAMGRRYQVSRGLDADGPGFEPPTSWRVIEVASVETDGLLLASSRTSEGGAFRIVGLGQDSFRVWCVGAPSVLVPCGRTDLRLVVQRTRLRVLAVDGDGEPVPSQQLLLSEVKSSQCRPVATLTRPHVTDEHGFATFDVEPFTDYLLQAGPPRRAWRSVSIPASAKALDPVRLVVYRPQPATLAFRFDLSSSTTGGEDASQAAYNFEICVRELPSAAMVFRSDRSPRLDGLEVPLAPGSYDLCVRPWLRNTDDPARQSRRMEAIRARCEGRGELVGSWRAVAWKAWWSVNAFPLADWTRQITVSPGERVELPVVLQAGWPALLELEVAAGKKPPETLDWIRTGTPIAGFVGLGFRHIATLQCPAGSSIGVYLTDRSLAPGRYEWQLERADGMFVRAAVTSGPFAVAEIERR